MAYHKQVETVHKRTIEATEDSLMDGGIYLLGQMFILNQNKHPDTGSHTHGKEESHTSVCK